MRRTIFEDEHEMFRDGARRWFQAQYGMTFHAYARARRLGAPVAVQVDTNDYWQKKENEILSQALKGIEAVRNTGRRQLGYADYGDPRGTPVFYCHGLPGSRGPSSSASWPVRRPARQCSPRRPGRRAR